MGDQRATERLSIGRFSALAGLTIRALRHYDDIGLLRPVSVDPSNGYRYYARAQLAAANRIALLRSAGVPLHEIGGVLDAWDDSARRRPALEAHRSRLADQLNTTKLAIDLVAALLEEEAMTMTDDVVIQRLEPEPIAMFRYRGDPAAEAVPSSDYEALDRFVAGQGGTSTRGIGLANSYDTDFVDLELGYVTEAVIAPSERFATRVVDGGEFACIVCNGLSAKATAYDALYLWLAETGRTIRGPIREYWPVHELSAAARSDAPRSSYAADNVPFEIAAPIF